MPCGYPHAFFPDEAVRSDEIDGVPGRILISATGPMQTWTLALRMSAYDPEQTLRGFSTT